MVWLSQRVKDHSPRTSSGSSKIAMRMEPTIADTPISRKDERQQRLWVASIHQICPGLCGRGQYERYRPGYLLELQNRLSVPPAKRSDHASGPVKIAGVGYVEGSMVGSRRFQSLIELQVDDLTRSIWRRLRS